MSMCLSTFATRHLIDSSMLRLRRYISSVKTHMMPSAVTIPM